MRTILKFLPMMALVGCMAVSCNNDDDDDLDNGTDIETPTDNGTQIDTIIGESDTNGDFILGHDSVGQEHLGYLDYGEVYYDREDTDFSSPQLRIRQTNLHPFMDEDGNIVSEPQYMSSGYFTFINIDLEIEPNTQDLSGEYSLSANNTSKEAGTCTNLDLNLIAEWGYDSSLGVYYPAKTLHMDITSGTLSITGQPEPDGQNAYGISLREEEGSSSWAIRTSATSDTTYLPTTNSDNQTIIACGGTMAIVIGGSKQ